MHIANNFAKPEKAGEIIARDGNAKIDMGKYRMICCPMQN